MLLNYFAYGSNMSPARLKTRVPSAKPVGIYMLTGHALRLHKVGRDGSAKADAFFTGDPVHVVHGVLFSMEGDEKIYLDQAEGLGNGYEVKVVQLQQRTGRKAEGFLYYATHTDESMLPFDWYMDHLIQGAEFAKLPGDYIKKLRNIRSIPDLDSLRSARERSLYE